MLPAPMNLPSDAQYLWDHIAEVWEDFRDRALSTPQIVEPKLLPHVHLNKRLLQETCGHAHVDLQRMIGFHNQDPVSGAQTSPAFYKFAGFLSRWISKTRPIYIDDGHPLTKSALKLNAYFALWVFRSDLRYDMPAEIVSGLVYSFHFRDVRSETLAMIAYTIDHCLNAEAVRQT